MVKGYGGGRERGGEAGRGDQLLEIGRCWLQPQQVDHEHEEAGEDRCCHGDQDVQLLGSSAPPPINLLTHTSSDN